MLALYATILVVSLFIIPGILFRSVFSLFIHIREFQRTRTEEITYAAKVALLPLLLAFGITFGSTVLPPNTYVEPAAHSMEVSDLSVLMRPALDSKSIDDDAGWNKYTGAVVRMGRALGLMVAFYYLLLTLEALILGWVSSQYGYLRRWPPLRWLMEKFLVPGISEWFMILTTFAQPDRKRITTVVDVLTSDDHLYHGQVEDYHLDSDGKLKGLLLSSVYRFDRRNYLRASGDSVQVSAPQKADYWKEIPGQNVYILGDKITNLNISYESLVAIQLKKLLHLDPTAKLDVST